MFFKKVSNENLQETILSTFWGLTTKLLNKEGKVMGDLIEGLLTINIIYKSE